VLGVRPPVPPERVHTRKNRRRAINTTRSTKRAKSIKRSTRSIIAQARNAEVRSVSTIITTTDTDLTKVERMGLTKTPMTAVGV
jgi:ribosomal protein L18